MPDPEIVISLGRGRELLFEIASLVLYYTSIPLCSHLPLAGRQLFLESVRFSWPSKRFLPGARLCIVRGALWCESEGEGCEKEGWVGGGGM